jgi:hypothetical protein
LLRPDISIATAALFPSTLRDALDNGLNACFPAAAEAHTLRRRLARQAERRRAPAQKERRAHELDQVRIGNLQGDDFVLLGIEDLSFRKVMAVYPQARRGQAAVNRVVRRLAPRYQKSATTPSKRPSPSRHCSEMRNTTCFKESAMNTGEVIQGQKVRTSFASTTTDRNYFGGDIRIKDVRSRVVQAS